MARPLFELALAGAKWANKTMDALIDFAKRTNDNTGLLIDQVENVLRTKARDVPGEAI